MKPSSDGGEVYCALYEFEDPEAIASSRQAEGQGHVILSNMPGDDGREQKTNDTYAAERQQIHDAGADVIDRFMPSGHIGHNKFQVLDKGGPQAVLFGSTNWTVERAVRADQQFDHCALAGTGGGLQGLLE